MRRGDAVGRARGETTRERGWYAPSRPSRSTRASPRAAHSASSARVGGATPKGTWQRSPKSERSRASLGRAEIQSARRPAGGSRLAHCAARARASALAPMPTRRARRAGGAIPDPAPAGDSSAGRGKPTRGGPSPGNASARASSTPARSRGGVAVAVAWALWALLGAFILRDARRVPIHGCAHTPPPFPDRDGIPPRVPTHTDPRDEPPD